MLYCGGGLAQDVITTIGQAFELRYNQLVNATKVEYFLFIPKLLFTFSVYLVLEILNRVWNVFVSNFRFKEFLKKTPGPRPPPLPALRQVPMHHYPLPDDPEYYNDLPGKAPPPTTPSNLIDFNSGT